MEKRYTIEELSELTALPRRTIRFYIQSELVSRPLGEKRGAWYTPRHLEELLKVKRLAAEGLSLAQIKAKEQEETGAAPARVTPGTVRVKSHIAIASGVDLVVDPTEARLSAQQLRDLVRGTLAALAAARKLREEQESEEEE